MTLGQLGRANRAVGKDIDVVIEGGIGTKVLTGSILDLREEEFYGC